MYDFSAGPKPYRGPNIGGRVELQPFGDADFEVEFGAPARPTLTVSDSWLFVSVLVHHDDVGLETSWPWI